MTYKRAVCETVKFVYSIEEKGKDHVEVIVNNNRGIVKFGLWL